MFVTSLYIGAAGGGYVLGWLATPFGWQTASRIEMSLMCVIGALLALAIQPVGQASEMSFGALGYGGFSFLGGIVGATVGYLIGTPPNLSAGDVITRGAALQGFNQLLVPAAQSAFNFVVAGVIVGAALGLAISYLGSSRKTETA